VEGEPSALDVAESLRDPRFSVYRGARCLVTGGAGFIGSNLVRALVSLGANVTVVDDFTPHQGANEFNLQGLDGRYELRRHSIGDEPAIDEAISGRDFVFNLAAKSGHLESLQAPFLDLEANVRAHLVLLEAVRSRAPDARVVFASSRSVYGALQRTPVDEAHPFFPTEVNSANKAAGELYHTAYAHAHGLSTISLRLGNVYGPRMSIADSRHGFINWFVRLAVEGGTIRLYGDGMQQRDLAYVDDVVEAFLLAGLAREEQGSAFNVASGVAVSLKRVAEALLDITGHGRIEYVPFPDDARRIEVGDYVADTRRAAERLGWHVRTDLQDGLRSTCRFYEAHHEWYVQDDHS
jgi:UDP-glucose 4-epimerase